MSDDIAIRMENVSKAYRIWASPSQRLISPLCSQLAQHMPGPIGRALNQKAQSSYKDFFALKDFSLEIKKGEAIGIVGRNGSGKSTLLQTIAGILQPTTGTVQVSGRVAALLELGSGFNPEFTGRENVFLNASILGLSEEETRARFDKIAAFAEIGEFIEQPVKTYSSGMVVRLAFAVAAHVNANILIIDEALSVGDARFQLKCARAIDHFIQEGVTLLFVSHDMNSVNRLCTSALLLDSGNLVARHTPRNITNVYAKMMASEHGISGVAEDIELLRRTPFANKRLATSDGDTNGNNAPLADSASLKNDQAKATQLLDSEKSDSPSPSSGRGFAMGLNTVEIQSIKIFNDRETPTLNFHTGETMVVRAAVMAKTRINEPIFAMRIRNSKGVDIYGTNTLYLKVPTPNLNNGDLTQISYKLVLNVLAGHYFISISCGHFEGEELKIDHRIYDAIEISVVQSDFTFGIANCAAQISVQSSKNTPLADFG